MLRPLVPGGLWLGSALERRGRRCFERRQDRLADAGTAILYDTGEVVNALPDRADAYNDPRMPRMPEIRREGVDLLTPQSAAGSCRIDIMTLRP